MGKDRRTYCTQNDGDCATCSLTNYGRDCRNNPVEDENEAEDADEDEEDETDRGMMNEAKVTYRGDSIMLSPLYSIQYTGN